MHEIGLVDDILCAIDAKIKETKGISKVSRANILIGEMEDVSPEHIIFHFREKTKGTLLEDVELNIRKVTPRFRCKTCRYEFQGEDGLGGCPNCKSKLNDIIQGTGVYVESIEIC